MQTNLPAVAVSGLSSNKPCRMSLDPELSLGVTAGQDGRPSIGLGASEADNTLTLLEKLINSSNKEQPSRSSPGKLSWKARADWMEANKTTEAIEVLPAGDWTREDKDFSLLASPAEQICDGHNVADAKCSASTNSQSHVSPTASPTTPPTSHTFHGSNASHDYSCTSAGSILPSQLTIEGKLMHRGRYLVHVARIRESALRRHWAMRCMTVRSTAHQWPLIGDGSWKGALSNCLETSGQLRVEKNGLTIR